MDKVGKLYAMSEMDEMLIARASRGDSLALEQVLAQHEHRLTQYLQNKFPPELKQVVDPSDVLQDVFFEACRLIGKFEARGEDSMFRWLVTIARHRIVDLARMHRTRRRGQSDDPDSSTVAALEQLAIFRRTPSQSAASHEFLAAVDRALARLPVDYRQAVTLRHIEGLSVAETALRMSRKPDSVYVLCCRGLAALRTELLTASHYF